MSGINIGLQNTCTILIKKYGNTTYNNKVMTHFILFSFRFLVRKYCYWKWKDVAMALVMHKTLSCSTSIHIIFGLTVYNICINYFPRPTHAGVGVIYKNAITRICNGTNAIEDYILLDYN